MEHVGCQISRVEAQENEGEVGGWEGGMKSLGLVLAKLSDRRRLRRDALDPV